MFSRSCAILITVVVAVNSIQVSPALADETRSPVLTYNTIDSDYWKLTYDLNRTAKQIAAAASSEYSPITFIEPHYKLWQKIPSDLKYSNEMLNLAKQAIKQERNKIESRLDSWASEGVTQVIKKSAGRNGLKTLSHYPDYRKYTVRYVLLGYDANGKQIKRYALPSAENETSLNHYLVRLDSTKCSLVKPTVKNKPRNLCRVATPKAKDWLRAVIISHTATIEANWGTYWFTHMLEETLKNKEDYTVTNWVIHSRSIDQDDPAGIPLEKQDSIFSYKITLGPDKWQAKYEMKFAKPQQLADGLVRYYPANGDPKNIYLGVYNIKW